MLTIGIDLGSTTVKYALLSESGVLLSHDYVRHGSAVKQTLEKVLRALALRTHDAPVHVLFSGSGALGLADTLGAGFVRRSSPLRATSNTERPIWMPPLNWAERTLSSSIYPTALNCA